MINKIPCGGFYLSGTLGVDDNGKLGVNGGEPYKSLVTDGDGGVKWEDRLAYDDSRLVVDNVMGNQLVKVSDEIPSWASVDSPMKVWLSDGFIDTPNPDDYVGLGNGSFVVGDAAFFITTDNFESEGQIFPEKGIYFLFVPGDFYIAGIASADSDTPEIAWDGNIETIKTIDPKYISNPNVIVNITETDGTFTADKTFDEIKSLIENGADVKCRVSLVKGMFTLANCMSVNSKNSGMIIFGETEVTNLYVTEVEIRITPDSVYLKILNGRVLPEVTESDNNKFLQVVDGFWGISSDLILPSSTPGSSKKFKITVDDSGAISATAV